MVIPLSTLMNSKCRNIYNDVLAKGTVVGASVHIDDNIAKTLYDNCNEELPIQPQPIKQTPIPQSEWPLSLRILARGKKPTDKGLGDLIERAIGEIGGDLFKDWWFKIFQKECGCHARKEWLNEKYPF